MLLIRLGVKTVFMSVCGIFVFYASVGSCFGTAPQYVAILKAEPLHKRAAAVVCFDSLIASSVTVSNVTKHIVGRHLKVISELSSTAVDGVFQLERTLISWLSYSVWSPDRIAKLRNLLSGLYDLGNNITNIRIWISKNNDVSKSLKREFVKVWSYARLLHNNVQAISGTIGEAAESRAILHTYSKLNEPPTDHYEEDMQTINNFINFFPQGNDITPNNAAAFLTSGADATSTNRATQKAIETQAAISRSKRLLYLQRNLFNCMNLMTAKMMKECFEPCVKAVLQNAFCLHGMDTEVSAGGNLATGLELVDNVIGYSEQESLPAIQELALAGIGGNPNEALPLEEIPASPATATIVLRRAFMTGPLFTQFVRSVVFVTNDGNNQAWHLNPGIIRVGDVVNMQDSTEHGGGYLMAPIKAAKENININQYEQTKDVNYVIMSGPGTGYRAITSAPVLASFYFNTTLPVENLELEPSSHNSSPSASPHTLSLSSPVAPTALLSCSAPSNRK